MCFVLDWVFWLQVFWHLWWTSGNLPKGKEEDRKAFNGSSSAFSDSQNEKGKKDIRPFSIDSRLP